MARAPTNEIKFSYDRLPALRWNPNQVEIVTKDYATEELLKRLNKEPSTSLNRAGTEALEEGKVATPPREDCTASGPADEDVEDNGIESEEEFIPLFEDPDPAPDPEPAFTVKHAPPWTIVPKHVKSQYLRLHNEIVQLYRYLGPTASEQNQRQEVVDRVQEVVTSLWPSARVEIFGSFATGLYLPSSDIDLVVLDADAPDIKKALQALAVAVTRKGLGKNVQVIAKAKVPIIKFDELSSGVSVDVSFDVANGPQAAGIVRDLMTALPPMRPLVTVLKVFLQQRDLNEVYTGGVGSYALLVMVATFLLTHKSRVAKSRTNGVAGELERSLGVLLVDFFRLYGRSLNTDIVVVSSRNGGGFLSKESCNFVQKDRPGALSVQDPNDASNDVGRGSFAFYKVRQAFDHAYQMLSASVSSDESLLGRIIRLDPMFTTRDVTMSLPPLVKDKSPQQKHHKEHHQKHKKEQHHSKHHKHERSPSGKRDHQQRDGRSKSRSQGRQISLDEFVMSDPPRRREWTYEQERERSAWNSGPREEAQARNDKRRRFST